MEKQPTDFKTSIMPKIRKIKLEDRKDMRGGGYSRRKFTPEQVNEIRREYATATEKVTISSLARKYNVSQPLMYQMIKGTTYTDSKGDRGVLGG